MNRIAWDYESTKWLLRFGRKHDGPWNESGLPIPDDGDAVLVCAAPVLLDACKTVLEMIENRPGNQQADIANILREAIEKAEKEAE